MSNEVTEFVKRMRENLKTYMPMLQALQAGQGIKADFDEAIDIIANQATALTAKEAECEKLKEDLHDLTMCVIIATDGADECDDTDVLKRYMKSMREKANKQIAERIVEAEQAKEKDNST